MCYTLEKLKMLHVPVATSPVGSAFLKNVVLSSIAGAMCVSLILQGLLIAIA